MPTLRSVIAPLLVLVASLGGCGGGDDPQPTIEVVPATDAVSDPHPKVRLRFNTDHVVGFLGEPSDLQAGRRVCWMSDILTPAQGGFSCGDILATTRGSLQTDIVLYQRTDVGTFVLMVDGRPAFGMNVESWMLPDGFVSRVGYRGRPYLTISL